MDLFGWVWVVGSAVAVVVIVGCLVQALIVEPWRDRRYRR